MTTSRRTRWSETMKTLSGCFITDIWSSQPTRWMRESRERGRQQEEGCGLHTPRALCKYLTCEIFFSVKLWIKTSVVAIFVFVSGSRNCERKIKMRVFWMVVSLGFGTGSNRVGDVWWWWRWCEIGFAVRSSDFQKDVNQGLIVKSQK